MNKKIKQFREAIKPSWMELRDGDTPRKQNQPRPEQFKQPKENAVLIELPKEFPNIKQKTFTEVVASRRSLRQYKDTPFTFEEMSYILWETARVDRYTQAAVFRTIPTGGATNAMETYVFLNKVAGINPGLYHYVQDKHILALVESKNDSAVRMNKALFQQLRGAAMVVILTAVPYRSEYKYLHTAHKMIAMEAGHAGQNASLAAEVIDAGAVCLAAYNQDLLDEFLQVDGVEEFSTYAITMGKK